MKRDMEKEKTRGRTRRKQPSQVAGFLYREGRKWCAAALSLCMILNNMASVTWAAESAAEKEVIFKLTSRSLYEALQEAVREETMADDHFLFEGKEKDVEAYEKLLLLDDDLYELKPEFENKDEVTDAEKKNDLQLRIFASLGWETDPEREYQVVGDEKIIFCLSNASETEQTAVIQVDEKTTEEIVLVPGSAVVIDGKGEEESLEAESGEESKEDGKADEIESGESEGQAEEENNSEGIKGVGGNGGAGGASGGNGGNSGNGSNGENGSNSSDSSNSSEREDIVESGSSAESEGTVESETSAKNEGSAGNESSVENKNLAENEGKADEPAADAEGQDKENKDSQETVNKPETGNSQGNTKEPENTSTQENTNTQDKAEEKDERKNEEVKNNPVSEKEETEKPDKTEAGSNESGKPDKAESGNAENGKADKPDKTDKSDNKESSKPETSEKSESGNTSTGKGEKTDTEKSGSERSGNSDSSKKSESSKDSSNSGSSDNSSDKGKEVSVGISRNVICLVADNLEVSASDDVEETESTKETTIIDTQEKQKEEVIEEELEEVKAKIASSSDVEDDEIEGELYAPVVVNEESIIVFVTTAEELGLNRAELRKASDSNAKRISPAYEGEVELENVIVQVKADENVLPEGVQLQVKELKEEGEDAAQYEEAKEALDSQGTEYDGMMALDISFLDKKGRKIEPDGNVQVSIKVKKESLPEEADLESIAVQHLAEDEGEIFVEEVADCGNKTRGNIEVEAKEHVEAAFEVDSFSVFTVTWTDNDGYEEAIVEFNLNFYSLDQNEEKKEITENLPTDKKIIISNIDFSKNEGEETGSYTISMNENFANAVQGYTFEHVEFRAAPYIFQDGISKADPIVGVVDTIKVKKVNSGFVLPYLVEIYPEGTQTPIICQSGPSNLADITLNVCYRETTGLGIIAEIIEKGSLTANRELASGQSYVWYKWEKKDGDECPTIKDGNGDDIRNPEYQVSRRIVTGSKWNIEQNGKVMNAVHDGGANHYYLVAIKDNETGKEIMASSPFFIDYSDELRNGSFESPVLTGKTYGFYGNGTPGLEWETTTQTVEIVSKDSTGDHNQSHFLSGDLPDGLGQCAELNARPEDGAGALYQDVLTAPGATLHWSLWHRARGNQDQYKHSVSEDVKDTMFVIIMPTKEVEEQMKEKNMDIDALKNDIINNPRSYSDSTRVWTLTSPRDWTFHADDYVVGDGQYLTRFFFVAGPVASDMITYGNLLDDIRFGSELPKINEGRISINKIVQGLSAEQMENYELTLRLKKINGTYQEDFVLNKFTSIDGGYSGVQSIRGLSEGKYTIEEVLSDQMMPPTVSMYLVETASDGTETKKLLPFQNTKAEIEVEEGKPLSIQIINSYVQPSDSFVINKVFKNGYGKIFKPDEVAFSNVEFGLYATDENWNISSENPVQSGVIQLDTESDDKTKTDVTGMVKFSSLVEGYYLLREISPPAGYIQADDRKIFVGKQGDKFGVYLYDGKDYICVSDKAQVVEIENIENEEIPDIPGAILPDTGGPGLAMFERYGWFLLMLALLMAGVEVRCYGERKYRRASAGQHEEFEDPL